MAGRSWKMPGAVKSKIMTTDLMTLYKWRPPRPTNILDSGSDSFWFNNLYPTWYVHRGRNHDVFHSLPLCHVQFLIRRFYSCRRPNSVSTPLSPGCAIHSCSDLLRHLSSQIPGFGMTTAYHFALPIGRLLDRSSLLNASRIFFISSTLSGCLSTRFSFSLISLARLKSSTPFLP